MFLKIMNDTSEKNTINLYECNKVSIEKTEGQMLFNLERNDTKDSICIVVNGEEPRSIYILNNCGKTIDSYFWNDKKIVNS